MKAITLPLFLLLLLSVPAGSISAEVINAGVGGNRSTNLLKRVEKDVIAHHPTVVVMMVGTNDRLNSGGFVSLADYQKNVTALIGKIRAGGSQLILVTPPPCLPELLFTRHDPEKFADQAPNDRMKEVRNVLIEIAEKEKLPLVDFHQHLIENKIADQNESSILRNPRNGGGNDGVHFTAEGYRLLAEQIAKAISAEKFDTSKVVCFGDSLTRGGKENYPAFLNAILNEESTKSRSSEKGGH